MGRKRKLFNVAVRRRGKFRVVNAQPLELSEAVAKGRGVVERSLAASFKIIPLEKGELVSVSLPSNIYRGSKREPGVFVQKAGMRLSSPTERKEIQWSKVKQHGIFY